MKRLKIRNYRIAPVQGTTPQDLRIHLVQRGKPQRSNFRNAEPKLYLPPAVLQSCTISQ